MNEIKNISDVEISDIAQSIKERGVQLYKEMFNPKNFGVPNVEITDDRGSLRVYDIFSTLNKSRIVMIDGEINDILASVVVAQLIYLHAADEKKPIRMYINSPGGSITSGMAIFDVMMNVGCPVNTIGVGMCASMGAFLLAAGRASGKAMILPTTEVMIHQPLGGFQGQATDIGIHAERILNMKKFLNRQMTYFAVKGRDLTKEQIEEKKKQIDSDVERDHFLSAQQALDYGLVDQILYSSKFNNMNDEMKTLGLL